MFSSSFNFYSRYMPCLKRSIYIWLLYIWLPPQCIGNVLWLNLPSSPLKWCNSLMEFHNDEYYSMFMYSFEILLFLRIDWLLAVHFLQWPAYCIIRYSRSWNSRYFLYMLSHFKASIVLPFLRGALGRAALKERSPRRWLFELRTNPLTMELVKCHK